MSPGQAVQRGGGQSVPEIRAEGEKATHPGVVSRSWVAFTVGEVHYAPPFACRS